MREVMICSKVRTAIGTYNGSLKTAPATELGADVLRETLRRTETIAHGHPIGASGAILTTRLLHSMKRDSLRHGLVTVCIGGGQGIALAVEALG